MVSVFSCLFVLVLNPELSENASPLGQNQAMKNENLIKALCETTEKCKALEIPFTRMQQQSHYWKTNESFYLLLAFGATTTAEKLNALQIAKKNQACHKTGLHD